MVNMAGRQQRVAFVPRKSPTGKIACAYGVGKNSGAPGPTGQPIRTHITKRSDHEMRKQTE
jgi:hypothetical protein